MQKYLSYKLSAISFFLIIMVVYLHSKNVEFKIGNSSQELSRGYCFFIQNFISDGLTRVAVPLFFCISAYLFFLNFVGTKAEFLSKFKKRFWSLCIPYIFWSLWGLFFYFVLQTIPFSKNFFTRDLISSYSVLKLFNTIFLNPIPYQFWFIKDLIVLVVFSPIIYWLIKYFKLLFICFLLLIWFFNPFQFIIFTNDSILFFAIGSYISLEKKIAMDITFGQRSIVYTVLWLLSILGYTILIYMDYSNHLPIILLGKVHVLLGVLAMWTLFDVIFRIRDINDYKLPKIFNYTFFIYAFHEPTLTVFKKAFLFALGRGEFASLITYLFAPIVTIAISILVAWTLQRILPRFYILITGGR